MMTQCEKDWVSSVGDLVTGRKTERVQGTESENRVGGMTQCEITVCMFARTREGMRTAQ